MIKTALLRNVSGQNPPSTDISKRDKAAAVNDSPALRYSATGVPHCAGKPIDPAPMVDFFSASF